MIMRHYYPRMAAVAGQYVPDAGEVWDDDPYIPIDHADAELVEKFIISLPSRMIKAIKNMFIHNDISQRHIVEHAARELVASKK